MIDFVEADTQPTLELTFRDRVTKVLQNLTGTTVTLRWKIESGAKVERAMTITDAVNGVAEYQFATGELTPGTFQYEATITDGTGRTLTTLMIQLLEVRARIS